MAGARTVNTMDELIGQLLSIISEMKRAPDADLPWIIGLETQVIQKDQEKYGASDQAGQMQPPGNAVQAPMGVSGGPTMPVGGPAMPMPGTNTGAGVNGVRSGPNPVPPISPDDMRRLLTPGPQGG